MQRFLTKSLFVHISFVAFVAILISYFISSIVTSYTKDSWNITEFLINYQGGFVRRGLLGEVILTIYKATGIAPYTIIMAICVLAYTTLILFFVRSIVKQGYTLIFLPFTFFLGNPLINDFWVRKDVLLILLFISCVHFCCKKSTLNLILCNIFLGLGILIHESIGFFGLPILTLLLANHSSHPPSVNYFKSLLISALKLAPAVLVFLTVIYFKGSKLIANQIWSSWASVDFPSNGLPSTEAPAAIDGLSWTLKQGLGYTYYTFRNFEGGIYAPLALLIIIVSIFYVLTNTSSLQFKLFNYTPNRKFNSLNVSAVLIMQLLTVCPLFILGWDYGRWIFFWTVSSFAVILIVPEERLSCIFPEILLTISKRINVYLSKYLKGKMVFFLCLIIGFPVFSWSLDSAIITSPIVILFQYIIKVYTAISPM